MVAHRAGDQSTNPHGMVMSCPFFQDPSWVLGHLRHLGNLGHGGRPHRLAGGMLIYGARELKPEAGLSQLS